MYAKGLHVVLYAKGLVLYAKGLWLYAKGLSENFMFGVLAISIFSIPNILGKVQTVFSYFMRIRAVDGRLDCVHDRFIISRGGPSLNGMSHEYASV